MRSTLPVIYSTRRLLVAALVLSLASPSVLASTHDSHRKAAVRLVNYLPNPTELAEAYKRADRLPKEFAGKACMTRLEPHWLLGGKQFWFRQENADGTFTFQKVDSPTGTIAPAFDHDRLAKALSASMGHPVTASKLPFTSIQVKEDGKSILFVAEGKAWTVALADYSLTSEPAPARPRPSRPEAPWTQDTWPAETEPVRSPDGTLTAQIVGRDVHIKREGASDVILPALAAAPNYVARLIWTPDSKRVIAVHVTPGDRKPVYLIESSPKEGGRAKLQTRLYDLPGDKVDTFDVSIIDVANSAEKPIQAEIVDYGDMPYFRWKTDKRHFTYEKMDRGYGRWRVIEVDSVTGESRAVVDDHPATFFDSTSKFSHYCASDEIVWRSERDGWGHLYLSDADGKIENQITKGAWVVRSVEKVDEKARSITFAASGVNPDEDPYFIHYYRVNFDGSGFTALTPAKGDHQVQVSPDGETLVDTYSTVTTPQVHELRSATTGKLLATLAKADIAPLVKAGWKAPEVFTAKGRDGKTDIWGIVYRPLNFDPHKKYPIVENIYAGPQDSFVPKSFAAYRGMQSLAELGFIVVQMDGMGTRNRSKAFHDVAYKNLADAGFPDRILWMKALAAKDRSADIDRVGVYGTSAGGQNSTGAMLWHPEFYKVAVSSCGCQDNRMDKIWWNEQWMGPMGPHYAEQSNITNAGRLRGKLLLMVGELDHNVPPESTYRLVDALIKAEKEFQLLVLPGFDHTAGGPYGERRRRDFFVKNLLGVEPPDWNGQGAVSPEPSSPKQ